MLSCFTETYCGCDHNFHQIDTEHMAAQNIVSTASGGGGQFDISHPKMAKIKNKMKNDWSEKQI